MSIPTGSARSLRIGDTSLPIPNINDDGRAKALAISADRTAITSRDAFAGYGMSGRAPQLRKWFAGGISGKTVAIVGDSTSDGPAGAAINIYNELALYQTVKGSPVRGAALDGVTVVDLGSNGQTAHGFNGGAEITAAIEEDADLYVYCFGINDVRLGLCDLPTLISRVRTSIETMRAALPGACFILRMPNPLKIVDDGFVDPYTDALIYAAILRDAYLSFVDEWDDVLVWDTWQDVFGFAGSTLADEMLEDALHPTSAGYMGLAQAMVRLIGDSGPTADAIPPANGAQSSNFAAPWTINPNALNLLPRYKLAASGVVIGGGTGYFDLNLPRGSQRFYSSEAAIVWVDGQAPFQPAVLGQVLAYPTTRWGETAPFTMTAGAAVRVYIDRADNDGTIADYLDQPERYPFAIPVQMNTSGSGYFRVSTRRSTDRGKLSQITTSDTLVLKGGTTISLSGASISRLTVDTTQFNKAGEYAAYQGVRGYVFGTAARSTLFSVNGVTNPTAGDLWYDSTADRFKDRTSTTNFLLESRHLTEAQRTAIGSPYVGQIVYQTDGSEGYYVFKSTGWAAL